MIGITAIFWKKHKQHIKSFEVPNGCALDAKTGKFFDISVMRRKSDDSNYAESDMNLLFMDGYVLNLHELIAKKNIQDVSNSHQPSIVLKGYEKEGLAFLKNLNGIFNLLIVNLHTSEAFIMNDRYGLLHLYYGENDEMLIFSPNALYVVKTLGCQEEINLASICDFLNFEFVIRNETFFKRVKIIPYACILKVSGNSIKDVQKYWDYPYNTDESQTLEDAIADYEVVMDQAIDRIHNLSSRPALALSGGLDSRTIAGILARKDIKAICYNVGFKRGFNDTTYSRKIAETIKTEWNFMAFTDIDYTSIIPEVLNLSSYQISYNQCWSYPVFKGAEAQRKNDAILDGMCLDVQIGETFTSFDEGLKPDTEEKVQILYKMFWGFSKGGAQQFFYPEFVEKLINYSKERINKIVVTKSDLPLDLLSQYYPEFSPY